MGMILQGGPGHFTLIAVQGHTGNLEAACRAAQARWRALPGLLGAAVHCESGGDDLIELLVCDARLSREIVLAVYDDFDVGTTVLRSGYARLMPGPDQPEVGFALWIDPSVSRPVLLSVLRCAPGRQQDLFDYLVSSAARFRGAFGGWVGAALFKEDGGAAIFEYLQFESLAAMNALQGLPILDRHRANLLAFGAMTGSVVAPIAIWPSMDVQGVS